MGHTLQLAAGDKRSKPLQCSAFSHFFQQARLAEDSRLVMCQQGKHLELHYLQHQARVPAGSSQEFPTALSFDAAGKCLLIVLSTHKVLIYDIEAQALAATLPSVVSVPAGVLSLHDRIWSISELPALPKKLILAGHDFLLALDLGQLALREKESGATKVELAAEAAETGTPTKTSRGAKRRAKKGAEGLSHISDAADLSPCVWRTYAKTGLRHIFGVWALNRVRWGKPVLQDHFLQPGSNVAHGEDVAGSKKRKRMDIEAMLLTVEVAPETI